MKQVNTNENELPKAVKGFIPNYWVTLEEMQENDRTAAKRFSQNLIVFWLGAFLGLIGCNLYRFFH